MPGCRGRLWMKGSKHYVTRSKLEKEEIARLDAEFVLKKEKKAHEQTKKEMSLEIAQLKNELAGV